GDLFTIVHEAATGRLHGLNASGWAPAAVSIETMRRAGFSSMPARGIQTVTVPGAVDGWVTLLQRFGRRTLAELLAPAIAIARDGFPVSEIFGAQWVWTQPLVLPGAGMEIFYPDGR